MTAIMIDEDVAPVARTELPRAPQAPKERREWPLGKYAKRAVLIALAVVLVYLVQTQLVAQVMFQQRQQHLAAEFKTPSPQIGSGEALGIVQVPTAGIDRAFIEDVTVDHLRGGPAHVAGSALPGDE
jgi:hypothetical protein